MKETNKSIILTQEGYEKLKEEIHHLKVVERRVVAEKIKVARAQGDLSENAEYDFAKDEQKDIEARILEIDYLLENASVISTGVNSNVISLGSTVKLLDLEFDEEATFCIVGSIETNPASGKISNESPLGLALLEKKAGETISYMSPAGIIKYKILSIN